MVALVWCCFLGGLVLMVYEVYDEDGTLSACIAWRFWVWGDDPVGPTSGPVVSPWTWRSCRRIAWEAVLLNLKVSQSHGVPIV